MIITFVLPGWSIHKPIGGFKVVYEYANRLSERGHTVYVVHPLKLSPSEERLKQRVKRCILRMAKHTLRREKVKWFKVSPQVNILIVPTLDEENMPVGDVIIATAWQTAEWVNTYHKDKGEKFYLIQHYEIWSGPKSRVDATWKMPMKKIVIARWLADKARELGTDVAAYIPNGIDLDMFRIIQPIEERNPQSVGMLYHIYDWKGSKDGVNALKKVKEEFPGLEVFFFSIYNPGHEVPSWVKFIKNPSIGRLVEIYNSCAIFVGSSWNEGWFLPGAEAMACGCAVVSTDCEGIHEYAVHEVNALLSSPGDPQALVKNIICLLEDHNLCMKLAKEGHEQIQGFTWDKPVKLLEEVLLQGKVFQ